MSRLLPWISPVALVGLVACGGPPPSPTLALSPDQPTTLDDLVLTITDDAELDPGAGVSYRIAWYADGTPLIDLGDSTSVPATRTGKGERWLAEVVPVDRRDREGELVEVSVTIANTPPTASVEVGPEGAKSGDDLVADATGEDVDLDSLTWSWTWLRDGVDAGISSDTVPAEATAKGEIWTVRVVPNDGEADGEAAEATISVGNSIPVAIGVALEPALVYEETTLVAVPQGSDADGDELSWSFAWSVDGSLVSDVTGPELTGASFDKGDRIGVVATPNDGLVDGGSVSSDEVVVSNSAPSVESATIDPSTAQEATTLSCLGGGWADPDGDPEGYSVEWEIGGMIVSAASTLTGADFDKGDSVACVLTPWDGEAEGAAVRSEAVVIANTPPVLADAAITPSAPKEGDTLSVSLGSASDADGDEISFAYAWSVNGATTSADSELGSTDFDKDDVIVVEVTPTDGDDAGAAVRSASVTVVNTPPEIGSAAVTPTTLYTTTTAVASVGGLTDADGDELTLSYAWYVDGSVVGGSGGSLAGSFFEKNDKVWFVVTASDGDDDTSRTASALTVANSVPTAPGVAISPASPEDSQDLVCGIATEATDADGDSLSYDIDWYRGGSLWTGGTSTTTRTGDTISASDTAVGATWQCYASAYDGTAYGPDGKSGVVTIVADPAVKTYTFLDTTADDVASDSLNTFFRGLGTVKTTDFIFLEVDGASTSSDGAWCAERADWYVSNYITYASGSTTLTDPGVGKYSRAIGGGWSARSTTAYTNYFGTGCDSYAYSWCSMWGFGGRSLGVFPGNATSGESYASGFSAGANWKVTIKVGATRSATCGF